MTREVETGSKDRESNMVKFAVEGLKLVRDTIKGEGGGGGKDARKNTGGDVQEEGVKLVPGDKEKTDDAAVGAFPS